MLCLAGLLIAIAIILCVTPVRSAPANDRASAYSGIANAHPPKPVGRLNPDSQPVENPKPVQPAEPDLPQVTNAAGEPLSVTGDCEENLAIAAKRGLTLPKGWDIKCVGPGLDWSGNSHWGVTCPYDACPEGAGPYLSISNPNYYVVAHELCHANYGTDELMADQCAEEHGASLETSPYQ